MKSLTSPSITSNKSLFDQHIKKSKLFSTRIANALIRHGIITPRLLIMHTLDLLHNKTANLGPQAIQEIQNVIAKYEWEFASKADEKEVLLTRQLVLSFYNTSEPLSLDELMVKVHQHSSLIWPKQSVKKAIKCHPYIRQQGNDSYVFHLHKITAQGQIHTKTRSEQNRTVLSPSKASWEETIYLEKLWSAWLVCLSDREQQIILSCYGVYGEDPATLQDIGDELDLTRERVRQIRERGVRKLRGQRTVLQQMSQLLLEATLQANHLLTAEQWEHFLDGHVAWETNDPRPSILFLLCNVVRGFHYINRYQIATTIQVNVEHLNRLNSILKLVLRQSRKIGLTADELVATIQCQLPPEYPDIVKEQSFLLKAAELFDRVGVKADGRYFYLKNKLKIRYPSVGSGWAGKPGTRLHEWEMRLREQFNKIAWIGQLRLTDEDFQTMCHVIQIEAQEPNYFSKIVEGQPLLVPPAVFITTMVLAARYIENDTNDAVDEFWHPYLRTVWGVEYTQAFYVRCKKRFNAVIPFLEETYGFEFPRTGKAQSDVITPIYRHALIPKYMQSDFAKWLYENWQSILATSETPTLLRAALQADKSLDHFSRRLGHFIRDEITSETAASLVTSMATAISLHVDDKESITSISELLVDTPIEQELWHEISAKFTEQNAPLRSAKLSKPRVTWVWLLDEGELCLRIQNIVLSADHQLEGKPDRLVVIEQASDDPLLTEFEVEVVPWRMKTGEYIIHDIFLKGPDSPPLGSLVLLTDLDETAIQLDIPPHSTAPIQFYRITQQGTLGIPIDASQLTEGEILICAEQPISFTDEDEDIIEIDNELPVPYPLTDRYGWSAQVTLSLPSKVQLNGKVIASLEEKTAQSLLGQVSIDGATPVLGLSPQIQPTFADISILLTIELNGEGLLKQTSLWITGQSGLRRQHPLAELLNQGHLSLIDGNLRVDLSKILPFQPDLYTVELRSGLQPILPTPLQFAVVPNLKANIVANERLYTPIKPFQVVLHGIDKSAIAHSPRITIDGFADNHQRITWKDLRYEPQLILQFDSVEIPLGWSIPRFTAWLEPKPSKPFLTIDELYQSTLHAVCSNGQTDRFTLFVSDQYRTYSLKRGRAISKLGQSQIYDAIRLSQEQSIQIEIQTGSDKWPLLEVHRYPQLLWAKVEYDEQKQVIGFQTNVQEEWEGRCRFLVENLTHPLAPLIEIGNTNSLKAMYHFPAVLSDGTYAFHVEFNGAMIALEDEHARFTVGDLSNNLIDVSQLAHEMRTGQLISLNLAEDFLLNLVEMAEVGDIELSPSLLYQLTTIPISALEYIALNHAVQVWHTLAVLKQVHNQPDWTEAYGLLPAWMLLPKPVILITFDHRFPLRVYPIEVLQGGRIGKGYGRWRMSSDESIPKEFVYVEWQPVFNTEVQIKAGLPDSIPTDWSKIDLDDTYGLHYCPRCGRLTGTRDFVLPEDTRQGHLHGYPSSELRDITQPEEYGGYSLLAKFYFDRQEELLQDIYQKFEILCPLASSYLPEPHLPSNHILVLTSMRQHLPSLLREIMQYGADRGEASPWASAVRMLQQWKLEENVSELGQFSFALAMLIRSAAYDRTQFFKLLTKMQLSESIIIELLDGLNKISPAHLEWGLTWAELLILHSPGKIS